VLGFWDSIDVCIARLEQLREHTQAFLRITSKSKRLRERFHERFQAHSDFWEGLEHICGDYLRQYQVKLLETHAWIESTHLNTYAVESAVAAVNGARAAIQPVMNLPAQHDVKRPKRAAEPAD
jgi:hypothetical protein